MLLRGMEMKDIRDNPTINTNVVMGSLSSITPGSGRVAIGSGLADALGAQVGSQISLIIPQGQTTRSARCRESSYTVGAIFKIGVYDYDKAYVMIPMEDAQTALLMGDSVGMIEIQTDNPDKSAQYSRRSPTRSATGQ